MDGYGEVLTPQIMDVELWKQSGHYDYYGDAMFFTEAEGRQFAVKPMNCPGACLVFSTRLRSYRDLPLRFADFGRLHRAERSGVITGLTRVRTFCQDDAHIFCTEDQIESEVMSVVGRIREIYQVFGFDEVAVELSGRPAKAVGTAETWERAQATLEGVLEKHGIPYTPNPGEGAFYAPKIDFQVKDFLGRSWQLGTVQLDYQLPERFALKYTDAAAAAERQPVLIHRAMLGSLERFIGHPGRAHRRRLPAVASAAAGGGAADLGEVLGVRRQGHRDAARRAASASSSTTAARSWATASARRRCRRRPTCWWWAGARPRPGRCRCGCAAARSWGRWRSTSSRRGWGSG